jgi:hypothetical protein
VYATQPKLRVQGTELPADNADAVKLTFLPPLKAGKDYTLSVQPTALVLALAPGRAWVELEADGGSAPLYLTGAKVGVGGCGGVRRCIVDVCACVCVCIERDGGCLTLYMASAKVGQRAQRHVHT